MTDKRIRIILDSKQAERNAKDLDRSMKGVGKSADDVQFAMKGLAVAVAAAIAVERVLQYADAWTNVQNQLKRTTTTQEQLTSTSLDLLKVANDTRNALDTTVDLYTSLTISTKSLNLSQQENVGITKTINNLFLESGKSAAETAGAVRQLGQALQSGALRGDEFNSVAEGAPGILRAIQKETGKTAGELRALAADGKITSELIVRSLQNYGDAAQKAADKTNTTLSQALTVANNNLTAFIGTIDSATGASTGLAKGIVNISNRLTDKKFLESTATFVKSVTSDLSIGVGFAKAQFEALFGVVKAGFTDSTVLGAMDNYKKALADIASQSIQSQINNGSLTPQSNMKRPTGKEKILPEKSPIAAAVPTKEEIAAAKEAYKQVLDIQSQFWDAVDSEGKQRDTDAEAMARQRANTDMLRAELETRTLISQQTFEQQYNYQLSTYQRELATIQNQEALKTAELQKSIEAESQARAAQRASELEFYTQNNLDTAAIKAEFLEQDKIIAATHEEELFAIRQEGVNARAELDRAEYQARLDSVGRLGEALISLGQGQSKKIFKIGQTLALAQAAVALPTAVMESFKNGGGFPWGLAPAAAMLATGLKNIQLIKSAGGSLGGGGGGGGAASAAIGGGSMGGGPSIQSTANSGEAFRQKQVIEIRGISPDSLITGAQLVDIMQRDDRVIVALNGAQQDAQRRGVI